MVGTNGHGIEELRRRFADWRRIRARGTRIPAPLWKAAVNAAREGGVHRTSKQLGVDYYSLARRLEGKPRTTDGNGPSLRRSGFGHAGGSVEFVEIPGKVLSGVPACVVEIRDGKDRRLRVELRDASGAESLARSLWKARR